MKGLYPIKEFSKLSGVGAATLRYWDEIGIFSPTKRDPVNNYRYYTAAQLLALNFVTTLSDLGIPLKTIGEMRNERSPDELLSLLEKRERELDTELRTLRMRSSIIHARQELVRTGLKIEDETKIEVVHLDARDYILWPRNEYKEGDTFLDPLAAFINQSFEHHVNLCFPVGGCWDSMESFIKDPSKPEHFISLDPFGTRTQKAGEYMVGYTRGYYAEMGDLPFRMEQYAKEHSLYTYGPLYTIYLYEETCTKDTAEYLAQSYIAVSKSRRKARERQEKPHH